MLNATLAIQLQGCHINFNWLLVIIMKKKKKRFSSACPFFPYFPVRFSCFHFSDQVTGAPQSQQKSLVNWLLGWRDPPLKNSKSYKINPLSFGFNDHKSFLVNGNSLKFERKKTNTDQCNERQLCSQTYIYAIKCRSHEYWLEE